MGNICHRSSLQRSGFTQRSCPCPCACNPLLLNVHTQQDRVACLPPRCTCFLDITRRTTTHTSRVGHCSWAKSDDLPSLTSRIVGNSRCLGSALPHCAAQRTTTHNSEWDTAVRLNPIASSPLPVKKQSLSGLCLAPLFSHAQRTHLDGKGVQSLSQSPCLSPWTGPSYWPGLHPAC